MREGERRGGKEGWKERDKRGRESEGASGEGKDKHIVPITSTSDYPHSPTAPGSVILATVNFVAVRCCAEPFAVSNTLTLDPIKIGTSGTPLWTNAFTCLAI